MASLRWIVRCAFLMPLALGGLASYAENIAGGSKGEEPPNFLSRHFSVDQWEIGSRFRYMDRQSGRVTDRDIQFKNSVKLRVNLAGRMKVNLRGETGSSFSGSFAYSGVGSQRRDLAFNIKTFNLTQQLGRKVEAQAGGLEFDQGAGTEATYADNDGFLVGYRLGISNKTKRRPDKIGITVGYVGDFRVMNVFSRLRRLSEPNYIQLIATKQLGQQRVSAQVDRIQAIYFVRPAVRLVRITKPLDEVIAEAIIRTDHGADVGWAATLSKKLSGNGRWTAYAAVSRIPATLFRKSGKEIFQNGDSISLGPRVGGGIRFTPVRNFEVSLFGSRRLDESTISTSRWRGQFQVRYQLQELMNQALR